jgi:hypothetical protein
MIKTTLSILPLVAGLLVTHAVAADAQTTTSPTTTAPATTTSSPKSGDMFVSFDVGAQIQSREFVTRNETSINNEVAVIDGNQTVGSGLLLNFNAGYHMSDRWGFSIGLWSGLGKGDAAFVGSIPDPLFFGRFTTVSSTGTDLAQRLSGLDLQFFWTIPVGEKMELSIVGGPSLLYVQQQIATFNLDPATGLATATFLEESEFSPLAGNVGVIGRYRLTATYSAQLLLRYVGGQVDLPSSENLTVGGFQVAGGLQLSF